MDEDAAPIVGAIVTGRAFVDGELASGSPCATDAAGRFEVEVVNDDIAELTVVAPGFIDRAVVRSTRYDGPLVLRRENRSRVHLHLSGAVTEGDRFRVLRPDETMTLAPAPSFGRRDWPPESSRPFEPAEPELTVTNGTISLPDRFEPGVTRLLLYNERASAGPVWIHAPPRSATLELDVKVLATVRLDLVVTNSGVPQAHAALWIRAEGIGRTLAYAETGAEGRASLTTLCVPGRTLVAPSPFLATPMPLPDRDARLEVEMPTLDLRSVPVEADPAAGSSPDDPVPTPPPPRFPAVQPPGRIAERRESGRIVGRVESLAWPPLEMGLVFAVREPDGGAAKDAPAVTTSAGLGSSPTFQFDHQPPGRYVLVLRCGAYAASSETAIEVRPGETTDAGELRLRRGATLSGRVSDAAGLPRAFTRVRLADDAGALTLDTWTGPDGGYDVVGLWPGAWIATVGEAGAADFARARARVSGDARVRLDLRPPAPR